MDTPEKLVLFHGFSDDEARFMLRLIKENMSDSGSISFCMSTPSNLEWKLKDVVKDVTEEHAYMKAMEKQKREESKSPEK